MVSATFAPISFVGPDDNGIQMTATEFDTVSEYDDRFRYELINGVLIVSPMAGPGERDPNEELGHWLREYRRDYPGVIDKTLFEQYVPVGENRRRADRVIWIGLGRVPDPQIDVPTVVVEFVAKSRRDRLRDYESKRVEYLNIGVSEYWVIDRFDRTMTIYTADGSRIDQRVITEDESYQSDLLPGFRVELSFLLGLSDEWNESTED